MSKIPAFFIQFGLVVLFAAACGDSDPQRSHTDDVGADAGEVADVGRGDDTGPRGDADQGAAAFVGQWTTRQGSGTGTMTCDGVEIPLGAGLEGRIEQAGAGLVLHEKDGCDFALGVDAGVAVARDAASCEQTNEQGTTQRLEIDTLRLTLVEGERALAERFVGRLVTSGASESTCEMDFSGTLEPLD